ncbi:MAG: YdeI/OmpD-associated family protein [Rubrivivax sp.]
MTQPSPESRFEAKLLRPALQGADESWAFLIVPPHVSKTLPRRGRTTVEGAINDCRFQATLEPDGRLSHWLRISSDLRDAAGAEFGDTVAVRLVPMAAEPEPHVPADLQVALAAAANAYRTWTDTTTIARVDWIHWIESAKQAKTRAKRIDNACDMLASGKKRICCFDPSGYYSKALRAPGADDFCGGPASAS